MERYALSTRLTLTEQAVNKVFGLPKSLARHMDDPIYHRGAGRWYGGRPYQDVDGHIRYGFTIPHQTSSEDGSPFLGVILGAAAEAVVFLLGLTFYWIWRIL